MGIEKTKDEVVRDIHTKVTDAVGVIARGVINKEIQMDDRELAKRYAVIKGDAVNTRLLYDSFYKESAEENFDVISNARKVLCINDNFGMNSFIKRYSDVVQYDTVIVNGIHKNYCNNVVGENMVDGFLTELPDLSEYDTIIIDNYNLSEKNLALICELIQTTHSVVFLDIYEQDSWKSAFCSELPNTEVAAYIKTALDDTIRGKQANNVLYDAVQVLDDNQDDTELDSITEETRASGDSEEMSLNDYFDQEVRRHHKLGEFAEEKEDEECE